MYKQHSTPKTFILNKINNLERKYGIHRVDRHFNLLTIIMNEENNVTDHQGEREVRIAKVQKMKAMGVIPYAQSFDKKNLI
jgi:hypothetical protein